MNRLIQKARLLRWALVFVVCASFGYGSSASAASYQKALRAYTEADYDAAFKLARNVARKTKGRGQAKALVLAAAAAFELDRSAAAKNLIQRALAVDPQSKISPEIKNKRFRKLFRDVRDGGKQGPASADSGDTVDEASSSSSGFGSFSTYLPLGINQFSQGKYLMGFSFGLTQAFLVYTSLQNTAEADKADSDAKRVIEEATANGDELTPEFLTYIDDNEAFVKKTRSQAQLSLGLAALAYVASVLEAGLFPPTAGKPGRAELDEPEDTMQTEQAISLDLRWEAAGPIGLVLTARF